MSSFKEPQIVFNFEDSLVLPEPEATEPPAHLKLPKGTYKTVVCSHWLIGMCALRELCHHLHRLDSSKSDRCKRGNDCKVKTCMLKHIDEQGLLECLYFRQGFCYQGPSCKRKHIKRSPDECPKEAAFEQVGGSVQNQNQVWNKKAKSSQRNENYKVTLCEMWLEKGCCQYNDTCLFAHGEAEICESMIQQNELFHDFQIYDPTRNLMHTRPEIIKPFPENSKITYFLVQAPDLRSLSISRRRSIWQVSTRIAPEINAAYRACDYAILIFCVRSLKGIYGMARVAGLIKDHMNPNYPLTVEFPVEWIRTFRVSLRSIAQLKINETGIFIGRTFGDARVSDKTSRLVITTICRKEPWDWGPSLDYAEVGITRLSEAETYQVEKLLPDQMFTETWVEYVAKQNLNAPGKAAQLANLGSTSSDYYKDNYPGFIFSAVEPIIGEMFHRFLFGLPAQMKDVVIHIGAPLFLFDPHSQSLYGIFSAQSLVIENLDPKAFLNWSLGPNALAAGSLLPLQVKFRVELDAPPINVAQDHEFRSIFKDFSKAVGTTIGLKETKQLANLFATRAGINVQNDSKYYRNENVTSMYKPAFKNIEIVPIEINAPPYNIKRKLLGDKTEIIQKLIYDASGGNPKAVRVRMRGIGSGYPEGPEQKEAPEPLNFHCCAETEELLARAIVKVKELVARAKRELEG